MSDAYREIFEIAWGEKVAADPAHHRGYSSSDTQAVPWSFKHWSQLSDELRAEVEIFLRPENWQDQSQLKNYKIYLRDWCSFPERILNLKGENENA